MKHLREICAGLIVGSTLLIFTGCETRVSGGAYYDYDYYPGHDVYFYPQGRTYYWNEGGRWRSGRDLPPQIDIHAETHETFRGHTRQPWTEHHTEPAAPGHDHDSDHDHDHH